MGNARLMRWIEAAKALFFPRLCLACGTPLISGVDKLCVACNINLPRTGFQHLKDNEADKLFWGKVHIERVVPFFYYRKGSDLSKVMHKLKYESRKDVGIFMGRMVMSELQGSSFIHDIDCIVPLPLHPKREKYRGYNQSEMIALGVSQITGLPVYADGVVRSRETESQTRKSVYERWTNVEGVFILKKPELFSGKHILLIDDVLTTGATCAACASSLLTVEGVRVSILTLAIAGR